MCVFHSPPTPESVRPTLWETTTPPETDPTSPRTQTHSSSLGSKSLLVSARKSTMSQDNYPMIHVTLSARLTMIHVTIRVRLIMIHVTISARLTWSTSLLVHARQRSTSLLVNVRQWSMSVLVHTWQWSQSLFVSATQRTTSCLTMQSLTKNSKHYMQDRFCHKWLIAWYI